MIQMINCETANNLMDLMKNIQPKVTKKTTLSNLIDQEGSQIVSFNDVFKLRYHVQIKSLSLSIHYQGVFLTCRFCSFCP